MSLSRMTFSTSRRLCRSPRLALLISRSAKGRSRFALASVVVIRPCWNSDVAKLASISRSWAGPPPRRGPLVGVGMSCSLVAAADQAVGLVLFRLGEAGVTLVEAVVVVADDGGRVEPGRAVLEREAHAVQLALDLVDGLRTEVADVHQVRLAARDELTDAVDAFTLEAVVGADGEVELLDRQGQVSHQLGVRRRRADLDALGALVELAREPEQLDQGVAGGGERHPRGHRRLGLDVDHEAVEVGALLDTGRL